MTNPITDAQLDEIDARHNAATPGPWGSHRDLDGVYTIQARPRVTCAGMETDGDIATLAAGRTDAESYANARFIGHAREDVPALLAEVRRLRARVTELEGPAVEAKRAEIRQSFVELAAQAEQDRDYEGAFDVRCRLRDREEQWKREDA